VRKAEKKTYIVTLKAEKGGEIVDLVNKIELALKHTKGFVKKKEGVFKAKAYISQHNPREAEKYTVETGKRGRPKTEIWSFEERTVEPHVHMVINCSPADTIIHDLRKYWKKRTGETIWYKSISSEDTASCLGYASDQASFERGAEYPKGYECQF